MQAGRDRAKAAEFLSATLTAAEGLHFTKLYLTDRFQKFGSLTFQPRGDRPKGKRKDMSSSMLAFALPVVVVIATLERLVRSRAVIICSRYLSTPPSLQLHS
jgi:hypothetical protein